MTPYTAAPVCLVDVARATIGGSVRQLSPGDFFSQVMSFRRYLIDPVPLETAIGICTDMIGSPICKPGVSHLLQFLNTDLWDRPLLASLLGTYLRENERTTMRITELQLFDFVLEEFIHEVATSMLGLGEKRNALSHREDADLHEKHCGLLKELAELSFKKS